MSSVVTLLKHPVGDEYSVGHLYRSALRWTSCGPILRNLEFLLEAQRTLDAWSYVTVERYGELDARFRTYIGLQVSGKAKGHVAFRREFMVHKIVALQLWLDLLNWRIWNEVESLDDEYVVARVTHIVSGRVSRDRLLVAERSHR